MKKCFKGYSVKQVDELIISLQNQNDDLVLKVTNLTMQLAAIDAKSGNGDKADMLSQRIQELENIAKSEKTAYEKRIKELSSKNNDLMRNISDCQFNSSTEQVDPAKVGEICSHAYSDMAKMKEEVSQGLVNQINGYTNLVSESNAQMVEALGFVDETYDDLLANVVEHLEIIFNKLELIDAVKDKIRNSIIPVKEIAANLNNKIKESVENSMCDQRKDEIDTLRKLGQDQVLAQSNSEEHSPLESFRERHLKEITNDLQLPLDRQNSGSKSRGTPTNTIAPPSQRIIGIRANVAANEVFNNDAELA